MREDRDWLYARLYCPGGDDTDALLPAVAAWLEAARERWEIDSAHLLRFVDLRGHHLRLRVKAAPDVVDQLAAGLAPLDRACRESEARVLPRLVPDPLTSAEAGRAGVALAVYGPEYAKYGGPGGVEAAEAHFDAASRWCLGHRVWEVPRPEARAALAAHYLARAATALARPGVAGRHALGGAPAGEGGAGEATTASGLLAAHLRAWGSRLPAELRGGAGLEEMVRGVLGAAGPSGPLTPDMVASLDALAEDAALAVGRMGAGQGWRRAIDLVHIDVNRLGLNPAEEAVAGLAARYLLAGA